ncbi:hypothetical protein [Candidatus Stoquefichus sp. SB1]|jgi:5-bromo-4-chloroindolyl phosphate hydrolysis protein|uniref:hypothetical protein n=1 Tax=Candidatus Stoquefichus sp. SB1 TaxID=1658109 RepID=UPI00067EEECC|nr:hypothetical protein [Candidatus Stoquefichus sp. SB1]
MNNNSVDKANDLLYETLLTLVKFNNDDLSFQQKQQISSVIDNLEEVRHLLYELKNEIQKNVA